jgi:hypothetical protein
MPGAGLGADNQPVSGAIIKHRLYMWTYEQATCNRLVRKYFEVRSIDPLSLVFT